MIILGIDVGILHLALVQIEYFFEVNSLKVLDCKLINITEFNCNTKCELMHDKCIADYMSHVFVTYNHLFQTSDIILVERQPINGIVSVEQFIVNYVRKKVKLISPNSVYNYFKISNLDYENRKKYTVKYTLKYLEKFQINGRRHDVADAMFIILYYLGTLKDYNYSEILNDRIKTDNKKFIELSKEEKNEYIYNCNCVDDCICNYIKFIEKYKFDS